MMVLANTEDRQKYAYYPTAGGSMFPAIRGNERIVVKKVAPEAVKVGDVILFLSGEKRAKVAHRIIKKESVNGKLIFQTKGDHNDEADQPITAEQIIGKMVILKRKIGVFSFPLEGIEYVKYTMSCFFLDILHRAKRGAIRWREAIKRRSDGY